MTADRIWRMLPQIDPVIGHKVSRLPGISVIVTDRCACCGICAEGICFVDAIRLQDGRATISDACRGCGRCVDICPTGAIELTVGDTGFVDSTIARLTPLVDVT